MKLLAAALALGIAAPAIAETRESAPVAAPAADTDVQKLVALLVPEGAVARLAGKAFTKGMDEEIAGDASLKATFEGNPGLREQVSAKIGAEITRIFIAELPALRAQIATILTAELSPAEIGDALTFFASPTGQKLSAEVYESMGDDPTKSPQEMQQAALAAVMAKMTAEDYPALMAFGASPAAKKMGSINPKIAAASEAWATKLVGANRAKMESLAEQATKDFLAKKGN